MLTKTSKSEMDSMTTSTTPRRNTRRLRVITQRSSKKHSYRSYDPDVTPKQGISIFIYNLTIYQKKNARPLIRPKVLNTTSYISGPENSCPRALISQLRKVVLSAKSQKNRNYKELGPIQNLGQQQG